MKKTSKITLAILLALVISVFMSASLFAANGYNTNDGTDPSNPLSDTSSFTLTKNYTLAGDTTNGSSPAENFTVTVTPYAIANVPASANLTVDNMPTISNVTLAAATGAADTDNTTAVTATVTLPTYTAVGDYWYQIQETAGSTAGVTYDPNIYYLHVQVIHESNSFTNLIRLVTLHTAAPNADGTPAATGDTKNDGIAANSYSNGSLAIEKVVTGNMGDETKEYAVNVVFTYASADNTNNPVKSVISYTDGTAKTIAPAAWTYASGAWTTSVDLTLSHNETVTFTNIPYGVAYTVTETDYSDEGYTHTFAFADSDTNTDTVTAENTAWTDAAAAGTISDASDELTITNDKSIPIDVGVIVESAPFVVIALAAACGLAIILVKRKRATDR